MIGGSGDSGVGNDLMSFGGPDVAVTEHRGGDPRMLWIFGRVCGGGAVEAQIAESTRRSRR